MTPLEEFRIKPRVTHSVIFSAIASLIIASACCCLVAIGYQKFTSQ